jgi:glycosyltransferase involved in cell wall biosynthesis
MHEPRSGNIPFISVVIPARNAAAYLPEAIASVRAQTFLDYEIIVIDDGSTDGTSQIAAGFSGVRCLKQSNRGAAAARNAGIAMARGRYIAFLDADDLWLPDKLDKQAAWLAANPSVVWVYSDARVFDSATRRTICRIGDRLHLHRGEILRPLLLCSFIPLATVVVHRAALIDAGLFDEALELRIGEDWNLWLRLAEEHTVGLIDEPLALIRMHASNTSRVVHPREAYRSKRAILEQALARNPHLPSSIRLRARAAVVISTGLRLLGNAVRARRLTIAAAFPRGSRAAHLCKEPGVR